MLLLLPLGPAAVAQGAPPPTGATPTSACAGCEKAAIIPMHIISKNFYCHPDGTQADASCAAAHGSPQACCAACLKLNAEKQMCDAWFMNGQGGCFFKNCPPAAWSSGDCKVDPKPATVRPPHQCQPCTVHLTALLPTTRPRTAWRVQRYPRRSVLLWLGHVLPYHAALRGGDVRWRRDRVQREDAGIATAPELPVRFYSVFTSPFSLVCVLIHVCSICT